MAIEVHKELGCGLVEAVYQEALKRVFRSKGIPFEPGKLASDGYFEYSMVNLKTGRAEKIPQHVIEKYSV